MPARVLRSALATPIAALLLATVIVCASATHASAQTAPPAATPTIYKWVDENGIAHYTTDRANIPGELRDRVESRSNVASDQKPAVPGQPHPEDVMRDAVRTTPATGALGRPVAAESAAPLDAPDIAAPQATEAMSVAAPGTDDAGAISEVSAAPPEAAVETVEVEEAAEIAVETETVTETETITETETVTETTTMASPSPLSQDVRDENSAVSAAPPAALIPLDEKLEAEVAEIDQQIAGVEGEIAQREETLAVLISTADDERTMPLVDDPQFREISQRLPKLQAELQTLRERRNKIQPAAPTP